MATYADRLAAVIPKLQAKLGVSPTPAPTPAPAPSPTPTPTPTSGSLDPTDLVTGAGILGTDARAVPIFFDHASAYDSDTSGARPWKRQISTNVGGLGSGGGNPNNMFPSHVRYGDGRYADLVRWVPRPDASFGPQFAEPCFEFTLPGDNVANETRTAELACVFDPTFPHPKSVWAIRRKAMCATPPFTGVGDADDTAGGATYNRSQAAGWKTGPNAVYSGTGGTRLASTNWNHGVSVPGIDSGDWCLTNGWTAGIEEAIVGRTDAYYNSGQTEIEAVLWRAWQDATGQCYVSAEFWRKREHLDTAFVRVGTRVVSPIAGPLAAFYELCFTSLNYNQSRKTPLTWWVTHHAFFDADRDAYSADPLHLLG